MQERGNATITVTAAPIGRDDSGVRTVRIDANGLSLTDPLRVGDEVLIDGHLRRAGSVAVHESDRTRWVRTTWRQPTPRQKTRNVITPLAATAARSAEAALLVSVE